MDIRKAMVVGAGTMGAGVAQLFAQNGIEVIVGATGGTQEEIAAAYLAGTLKAETAGSSGPVLRPFGPAVSRSQPHGGSPMPAFSR